MVLAEVQELKNIGVPRLQVDGKSTWTLVSSLVHISGSVVEHPEHGNNTVGGTVGTTNVGAGSTDAVHIEADSTSGLRNQCTCLKRVIDTFNAILLHVDKEA